MSAAPADPGARAALVELGAEDGVAELVLRNPPLNLVTRAMLRDLDRLLGDIERRDDLRCVLLHGGSGRAFCAGSDMREFADLRETATEKKILVEDMILRRLARLPMPTIAAIDGPALGGGLELALACDLRVLRAGVAIGLPECRLGGLAGTGAVRLTRLVGPARAKRMLFTGETIDSARALAWGVVDDIAEDGGALAAARRLAATISARGPLSNRLAKQLVDLSDDAPLDAALSSATVAQRRIFESDDLHEGAAAFLEKRPPGFRGR